MLRRFKLTDFLSYASVDVELGGGDHTVAVVGDNGKGKSALLEALPYALFGMGRGYSYELSRDTGDGSHEVSVSIANVPNSGDLTVVTRGLTASGKGHSQVTVNGEIEASGQGTSERIEQLFGMDGKTFMLTAFFGMDSDNILAAVPSKRLEMLQSIARTHTFAKMYQKTQDRKKRVSKKLESARGAVAALKEGDLDADSHKEQITQLREMEKQYAEQVDRLRSERNDLSAQDEAYRALLNNRADAQANAQSARKQRQEVEGAVDQREGELSDLSERSEKLRQAREEIKDELKADLRETLQAQAVEMEKTIARDRTISELLSVAAESGEVTECPLCHSELGEGIVEQWKAQLKEIDAEIEELRDKLDYKTGQIEEIDEMRTALDQYTRQLEGIHSSYHDAEEDLKRLKHQLKQADAEVSRWDEEYVRVSERIDREFSGVASKIEKLNEEIEEAQGNLGGVSSAIKAEKKAIEQVKENRSRLKEAEGSVKDAERELEALEVVAGAFSRYGIPKQLLEDLRVEIERRATEVFSEFDSGTITIEDVEQSGKPGVEFYLYHESGKHRYKMLSQGQQAMFYFAVREAIAQIVSESRGVNVPFLVLDEITANLSPHNRDNLVRTVKHILQRRYEQVFMVSHASVREIFDRNIEVDMVSGASVAEVT